MKLLKARVLLSTKPLNERILLVPNDLPFSLRLQIHLVIHSFGRAFFEHHLSKSIVGLRPLGRIEILSQVVPFVLTSVFNRATNRLARPEWQE